MKLPGSNQDKDASNSVDTVKALTEAVALKYTPIRRSSDSDSGVNEEEQAGDIAPVIVAKEKGALARKMVEIAMENDVPVVEDEFVANVLSLHQIGACIPEETWQAVAGIFAYIQTLEKK